MPITDAQKAIVRSTGPILKENGKEITSIFYKEMFAAHPELLDLFNQTNQKIGTQPLALANTVYFAAENIDDLTVLLPQLKLIAHKHRALMVRPEHYPIVGKFLLFAIGQFLGEKATEEILEAWAAAYGIIASLFIEIEKELYNELGSDQGFIPFVIVKKEQLAKGPIVSLSLERRNGGELRSYQPGQYLTVRIKKDGHFHNRHYSLVQPFDGKTYRIAIKEEIEREPHGVVSTEIIDRYQQGDTILASLPAGTFTLVDNPHGAHLFIAGGIGITVLSAMILQLHREGRASSVTLVHCVQSKEHAAFAEQMRAILPEKHYRLLCRGEHLEKETLKSLLQPTSEVYLCGSIVFMNKIEDLLAECGHGQERIHLEAFQPSLSVIRGAVKDQSTTKSLDQ